MSKIVKKSSPDKSVSPVLNLGMQLAIAVAMGFGGGYWLDNKIGTLPLFTLIGLCVGAAAGFLNIYRAVYPTKDKAAKDKNSHGEE